VSTTAAYLNIATDVEIGVCVRRLRERRGLTLRAMAAQLGVSPATMSELETGKTSFSAVRLIAALRLLEADLTDVASTRRRAASTARPPASPSRPELAAGGWRIFPPLELDAVLTGAVRAFLQAGFHGSSMKDIAAAAGLSVAGLYHHYDSKQEILSALLCRASSDILDRCRAARDQADGPVPRYAAMVESLALFQAHRPQLCALGDRETRALEPAARRVVERQRADLHALVQGEVIVGTAEGAFDVADPDDVTRAVVTMCTALSRWYPADLRRRPEELARRYVGHALRIVHAERVD
jgi:AcrR family transcriptional regulator